MPDVDFNYFLNQKYAQLQQQANARSQDAFSGAVTAQAQAGALGAQANLDAAKAAVVGPESAAQIGLTRANTNLVGQQAQTTVPLARATIDESNARAGLTTVQAKSAARANLVYAGGPGAATGEDDASAQVPVFSNPLLNTGYHLSTPLGTPLALPRIGRGSQPAF